MLMLMLDDQADDKAAGEKGNVVVEVDPIEYVETPSPYLADIAPGLSRPEERERRPIGPRMSKGVVQVVEGRVDGVPSTDSSYQPQLLIVADVSQVPDERRHEW
jgi:hypothetical protein